MKSLKDFYIESMVDESDLSGVNIDEEYIEYLTSLADQEVEDDGE